jgi:uncharacterized protein (DUF302 family)
MTAKYAFGKTTTASYDDAVARVTDALAKEGFGVLTEIDVAATMKKKLGVDMPPYRILGACNVVVRSDEQGRTIVEAMDPAAVLGLVDRPEVAPIAAEVKRRLERVIASL